MSEYNICVEISAVNNCKICDFSGENFFSPPSAGSGESWCEVGDMRSWCEVGDTHEVEVGTLSTENVTNEHKLIFWHDSTCTLQTDRYFTATSTATSKMWWKKYFSPLPAECGEKKFFTAKIANLTIIHRANFNAYVIFTVNIITAGRITAGRITAVDGAVDYEVGDTHEVEVRTLLRQFLFVRIPVNAVKKFFHRKIQHNSYKNSPLSAH